MQWKLKSFSQLTTTELYAIMHLRNEVFVVEQNCVYQDADNKDQVAWHVMGMDGEQLLAYSRLFAPGHYFSETAAIGRIITASAVRGQGLGKELVRKSIQHVQKLFPRTDISLSGQQHLQKFYEGFGFRKIGSPYLEDGIPHVKMILS